MTIILRCGNGVVALVLSSQLRWLNRVGPFAEVVEEGDRLGLVIVKRGGGETAAPTSSGVEIEPVWQEFWFAAVSRRVTMNDKARQNDAPVRMLSGPKKNLTIAAFKIGWINAGVDK